MGYRTSASDWKVQLEREIAIKGVTAWKFWFDSADANYTGVFNFFGFGITMGGIIAQGMSDYKSLLRDQEFSASDLNWTRGKVRAVGVSAFGGGMGLVRIWANDYFRNQECGGLTIAIGSCMLEIDGLWKTN